MLKSGIIKNGELIKTESGKVIKFLNNLMDDLKDDEKNLYMIFKNQAFIEDKGTIINFL